MSTPGDLLLEVMADPDRPCRFEDPETFFHPSQRGQTEAAEICIGCPVQVQCLEYALATRAEGVWGGMVERDRERIVRRRTRRTSSV